MMLLRMATAEPAPLMRTPDAVPPGGAAIGVRLALLDRDLRRIERPDADRAADGPVAEFPVVVGDGALDRAAERVVDQDAVAGVVAFAGDAGVVVRLDAADVN